MDADRVAWTQRVIERAPDLADTLKRLRELFQAKVTRMHHTDPDLCWKQDGPWVFPENMQSEYRCLACLGTGLSGKPPSFENGRCPTCGGTGITQSR